MHHACPLLPLALTVAILSAAEAPPPDTIPIHDVGAGCKFTSIQAALDGTRGAPRRLELQAGEYILDAPLVLDARDSGTTIEAAPGATPILFGGKKVGPWVPDGERFWCAPIPPLPGGRRDIRMLSVNGRFAPRARFPKAGRLTHVTAFDVPWMSTTGGGWKRPPTAVELTTMRFRPEDLPPALDLANAELTVYHMWDESTVGVASVDRAAGTIVFSTPAGHPPGAFGVKDYVVWNVREGLTAPGQWYADRAAGHIVYWPLPGEDMAKAEVYAPAIESILILRGTEAAPLKNVTIRGLSFSVTNTPLVAGGFGAGNFPAAVSLTHAEDCRLERLTIFNVAGQGIKEWHGARLDIDRCEIRATGACGIKADGEKHLIHDSRIRDIGKAHPSAIALWVGGRTNLVTHNEIVDTPYSAIVAGGDGHCIASNRISRAMQELHDGAGIYVTFCKGVLIRGNWIRDIVDTGGYGASAYYLDEQAEDCVVEGNLAFGIARPSHNHMARRNTIRNNVFIADGDLTITFPRCADFRVEKNIVAAAGKIIITNPAAMTAFTANVLAGGGAIEGHTLEDYATKATGPLPLGDNAVAKPSLEGAEEGYVRHAEGSAAARLGIEPVDVRAAGPR